MRNVVGGLIQMSNPINDPNAPVAQISKAMEEKHLPYIEEAGKQGVQILCLQEVFNSPYFCPSQDAKWCDIAESIPGPTIERMQKLAKKHEMVMIVPIYEREMAGVYYNTAAVIDADGSYLGKYRKNHIPHTAGFWEKFFFKPGNLGYPVFTTRYATIGVYICYDRHFPEGARLLGLHGAEIVFNPSATVKGLLSSCAATSCVLVEKVRKATTNRTTLIFGKNDSPSSHADLRKNVRDRHGTQHSIP